MLVARAELFAEELILRAGFVQAAVQVAYLERVCFPLRLRLLGAYSGLPRPEGALHPQFLATRIQRLRCYAEAPSGVRDAAGFVHEPLKLCRVGRSHCHGFPLVVRCVIR
jgi:hypothetical protein